MAGVLETITIPRACSVLHSPSLAPVTCSSFSGPLRSPVRFSQFSGLKIQPTRSSVSVTSSSKIIPRGRRIVSEAQNTALEVGAVNDKTWKSLVVESDVPVLVEFWAPWCGPCRMIHPVVDELAKEYAGKLKFYKLNTDESPSTATEFGIRSIPTVMIFKNGEKKDAVIGAVPKSTLTTCIEKFL